MKQFIYFFLCVLCCLVVLTGEGRAFSISSDQNLSGGSANLVGGAETIVPSTGPVYDWSDNDGNADTNGVGDDVSNHLVLGGYRIYASDGASLSLKLGNSNGNGDITGNSGATNLSTARPGLNPGWSGSLIILGAGDLSLGGIDVSREQSGSSTPAGHGGSLTIGSATNQVGNVRVDFLRTGWIRSDGAWTSARGASGALTIHSAGDVRVQTSGGTPGDIYTWCSGYPNGRITINHDGLFRVNKIEATAGTSYTTANQSRAVRLNGDILDDGGDGDCEIVDSIRNAQTRNAYGYPSEGISICGYSSVSIGGDILCYHVSTSQNDSYAGDIAITNISGDITVGGRINANGAYSAAHDGRLILACSSGEIRVGDLDLNDVLWARFDAGGEKSWVTGVLTNFTAGTTKLRTPPGQKIYYDPEICTWYSNQVFSLYDLDGVSSGGQLRPVPIAGTIVIFK